MKLGLSIGYWGAGPPAGVEEQIARAEALGFDSLWTAEAYGSDALTPLAWWGSRTTRMRLGTSIMQMSAREPTAVGMAAMTMDHLTGGRFVCGLGVSGPQVVEGWYGRPFPRPLARTREYVDIVRQVVAREDRVTYDGQQYHLPYEGGTGLGKPLKSTLHPVRQDIPIYLAAEGPKNVALAAEIADGWFPFWYSPKADAFYREALAEGFARPGARADASSFEVVNTMGIIVHPDPDTAADLIRPLLALYVGGMGAKNANFHYEVLARLGWREVCEEVQELYLAGRKQEATARIPLEMVEDVALVGPPEKIAAELPRWKETAITTMAVQGPPELLEVIAELVFS